jgi:hypothetical protein
MQKQTFDVAKFRKQHRRMNSYDIDEADDGFQSAKQIAKDAGLSYTEGVEQAYEFAGEDDDRIEELQTEYAKVQKALTKREEDGARLADIVAELEAKNKDLEEQIASFQQAPPPQYFDEPAEDCESCRERENWIALLLGAACWYAWAMFIPVASTELVPYVGGGMLCGVAPITLLRAYRFVRKFLISFRLGVI